MLEKSGVLANGVMIEVLMKIVRVNAKYWA